MNWMLMDWSEDGEDRKNTDEFQVQFSTDTIISCLF